MNHWLSRIRSGKFELKMSLLKKHVPKYTEEDVKAAIEDIQNGVGKRAAAKKHKVPRATLCFRLQRELTERPSRGPLPIFNKEESSLVKWISDSTKRGFPRKKENILKSVQEILKQNPRRNPFKDDTPGRGWYQSFLKRHPHVMSKSKCSSKSGKHSRNSQKDVETWFKDAGKFLEEHHLMDVLNDPRRIFNCCETHFQLKRNVPECNADKTDENEEGTERESLTVMFTVSADGRYAPTTIVYPSNQITEEVAFCVPRGWGIGRSDTGTMEAELLYEFIANIFYPYVLSLSIPFPIILFVDGQKTKLTYQLSVLCAQLRIELVALHPNAFGNCQPADVAACRPIRGGWDPFVAEWRAASSRNVLSVSTFAKVLRYVAEKHVKSDTVQNAFRVCGLYPWDPMAAKYIKCLGHVQHCSTQVRDTVTRVPDKDTVDSNEKSPVERNVKMAVEIFNGVVGAEYLRKFRSMKGTWRNTDEGGGGKDFFSLFRLWEWFQQGDNPSDSIQRRDSARNFAIEGLGDDTKVEDVNGGTAKKLSNCSPWDDVIVWPETPETKGKQGRRCVPCVVTVEKYAMMFKILAEERAENGKKIRAKRKLSGKFHEKRVRKSKADANMVTVPRELNNGGHVYVDKPSGDGGTCMMCDSETKSYNTVACSTCVKLFHKWCVPKCHVQHLPDNAEDQFTCHNCFKSDVYILGV